MGQQCVKKDAEVVSGLCEKECANKLVICINAAFAAFILKTVRE